MNPRLIVLIVTGAVLMGSFIGMTASGRAQSAGHWQMVAGSGGDGAAAWKFNVDTGQSFFCYRTNCFASVLLPNSAAHP